MWGVITESLGLTPGRAAGDASTPLLLTHVTSRGKTVSWSTTERPEAIEALATEIAAARLEVNKAFALWKGPRPAVPLI